MLRHTPWVLSTFALVCSLSIDENVQYTLRTLGSDTLHVTISQGTTVGSELKEDIWPQAIEAFKGIPYALPPTGDRRFRPAVPVGPSNDIFDALDFGPRCPGKQFIVIPGADLPESEDCLTLNIFRPKIKPGQEKLPVGLYVHGGAFNRGTAAMHNTASMVAWSEKPFIGVSFNYRIGALGFLPSNVTAEEGLLNLGLKDQILMMEWVQENIEAFGGDSSQVTLFGLSAGAHSIGHHLMNHIQSSLFHRVIIESGAPTSRAVLPYDATLHTTQFAEFLVETGCSDVPSGEIFSCLRELPEQNITEAQATIFDKYNPSLRWAFQPVIDGDIISQRPIDEWNSDLRNRIPIMTGFSTNEASSYVPTNMSDPDEFTSYFHALIPRLSDADMETLERLYPDPSMNPDSPYVDTRNLTAIQVGAQYKRAEAAYAHYAYICPVRQTVNLASPTQTEPVYLYHWALNQTVKSGANHGDHIFYQTMDQDVLGYSESQKKVAWMLHAYWTSFITTGDPNALQGRAADRPEWVKYDTEDPKLMVFGEGNDERAGGDGVGITAQMEADDWSKTECHFWWDKVVLSEM